MKNKILLRLVLIGRMTYNYKINIKQWKYIRKIVYYQVFKIYLKNIIIFLKIIAIKIISQTLNKCFLCEDVKRIRIALAVLQ